MPSTQEASEGDASSDAARILEVRKAILDRIPKGSTVGEFFADLSRRAIDEVLSLGKGKVSLSELAPTEQTYVGTRLELLVRDALDYGPGMRADALIVGHEVDIKWSKTQTWMIGPENIGVVCLGIGSDRLLRKVSVGLFVPRPDHMGSQNRDRKYSIHGEYRRNHVSWLVEDAELPVNFIESLQPKIRDLIMAGSSAQERMKRLAKLVSMQPVPRAALRYVSLNKDDFMRRIRDDNSLDSSPLGDMVCLSEKYRKELIVALGMELKRGHFYFVPRADVERVKRRLNLAEAE